MQLGACQCTWFIQDSGCACSYCMQHAGLQAPALPACQPWLPALAFLHVPCCYHTRTVPPHHSSHATAAAAVAVACRRCWKTQKTPARSRCPRALTCRSLHGRWRQSSKPRPNASGGCLDSNSQQECTIRTDLSCKWQGVSQCIARLLQNAALADTGISSTSGICVGQHNFLDA